MDSPTQNSTQGATAHAGHYHRFRVSKPVSQCHHVTPTRSSDGSDAVDDRTRDDAGHCALGRPRWQLPDGAAFVHDESELGQAPMAADSSPSVRARRCDLDGRRCSGGDEIGQDDVWLGSVFFLTVWENRPWAGFSELIPD